MPNYWNGAVADVVNERQRQIEAEGRTPEHDDAHAPFDLQNAAAAYALYDTHFRDAAQFWPWPFLWFKPKGRRRNLVRAAALLIAEIERTDRLKTPNVPHERVSPVPGASPLDAAG